MANLVSLTPDMMLEMTAPARKPGTVLKKDYLDRRHLSIAQLAKLSGVPGKHLAATIFGTRPITPDIAVRLAAVLGTSAFYWLALQARWSLRKGAGIEGCRTAGDGMKREITCVAPPTAPATPVLQTDQQSTGFRAPLCRREIP
ncbi:HigA family addiction module antitoxin [Dyella telluris]|uniref:HigA family addiction module antidote protein n=1 Tax=Dyella telluris TaxID=2763498 RepID=A0A7G8Q8Q5_9GAMM|nr:HigA family addiction module antitoxin [Dyella telluris]QNK03163.1 HigA family addiction module antidote protein [Dyella telluris]